MKPMSFKDDPSSNPFDSLENHYVLVFNLTSMRDVTENYNSPQLTGEPRRLELNFIFPLVHVTELNVLGERKSSVAVDKFGVDGENIGIGYCFSSAIIQP